MEMIMNGVVLLLGIAKGCLNRLTLQEWGYLLGVAFTLLRGLLIWYDNRTEQRRRTAIFERYAGELAQRGVRQAWNKLRRLEAKPPASDRAKK
ncbi:hypothetical protein ACFSFZ_10415 [Mixta tenebrionis]|uniref:Uncharacterized protein n=1 Tax=Mixta tenebrionis TaxID=2562439 RepID=A0A506UZC7_9GAMM|nr:MULTISPECIES: hypothetical protein [Mixta]QHM75081.1 hypothetical protein C7M52_01030 [Mixta theicola]TPW38715.1 hypothetical protein FKM52_20355 [Mixta tenebrionis]